MMSVPSHIPNARILVVDDQLANVKLLEYMLAGAGYSSVSSTMDSREVASLHERHAYDLILLDLNMPHLNGFEVLEALKKIEKEGYLSVLVVTAEPTHKIRALQAGAKDFISKPIDQTELLTRVHNMLEIRLLHKNLRNYNETLELKVKERTVDLRAAEEKLGYLSNYDNVTGLPNRILLRDRVKRAQEAALENAQVMGLLVIDLARLPLIRGTYGSKVEQLLLVETARRLSRWAQADDTVARFGDDSFAIVAVRSELQEFATIARQIIALLDTPFTPHDQELHVEACVGIAAYPADGDNFDFLAQSAEASVRRAMESKAERYWFYTPQLNRDAQERLTLENALRRALERDELILHYQPQVDLKSGEIIGLEALVRWQHPELGLIPPNRFIGLAEETGLILQLGEWVLQQACRQNKAWQDSGLPCVPVAVNLSAKQFVGDIADKVHIALTASALPPAYLELEMTESISMEDPERTIGILRRLKAMGVNLSIDDFGTGYSNLNYLKRFPVDKLKLDQSFVRELISDPDDLSISRAVIAMAHSLRLRVIAEGVETRGQMVLLAQNGCDEMQGFFFSRPVDAATCASLLGQRQSLASNQVARENHSRTLLWVNETEAETGLDALAARNGFHLLVSRSISSAFENLASANVDVLLCDLKMSGIGSTEFLRRVQQMYPATIRIEQHEAIGSNGLEDALKSAFRMLEPASVP